MKIQRLPIKTRIFIGVSAAIFNGVGLFLWEYFLDEPLQYKRYILQGIVMGLFFFFLFRNKVTKE